MHIDTREGTYEGNWLMWLWQLSSVTRTLQPRDTGMPVAWLGASLKTSESGKPTVWSSFGDWKLKCPMKGLLISPGVQILASLKFWCPRQIDEPFPAPRWSYQLAVCICCLWTLSQFDGAYSQEDGSSLPISLKLTRLFLLETPSQTHPK